MDNSKLFLYWLGIFSLILLTSCGGNAPEDFAQRASEEAGEKLAVSDGTSNDVMVSEDLATAEFIANKTALEIQQIQDSIKSQLAEQADRQRAVDDEQDRRLDDAERRLDIVDDQIADLNNNLSTFKQQIQSDLEQTKNQLQEQITLNSGRITGLDERLTEEEAKSAQFQNDIDEIRGDLGDQSKWNSETLRKLTDLREDYEDTRIKNDIRFSGLDLALLKTSNELREEMNEKFGDSYAAMTLLEENMTNHINGVDTKLSNRIDDLDAHVVDLVQNLTDEMNERFNSLSSAFDTLQALYDEQNKKYEQWKLDSDTRLSALKAADDEAAAALLKVEDEAVQRSLALNRKFTEEVAELAKHNNQMIGMIQDDLKDIHAGMEAMNERIEINNDRINANSEAIALNQAKIKSVRDQADQLRVDYNKQQSQLAELTIEKDKIKQRLESVEAEKEKLAALQAKVNGLEANQEADKAELEKLIDEQKLRIDGLVEQQEKDQEALANINGKLEAQQTQLSNQQKLIDSNKAEVDKAIKDATDELSERLVDLESLM